MIRRDAVRPVRVGRRSFLRLSALGAGALALPGGALLGCDIPVSDIVVADDPGQRWMFHARIAGLDLSEPGGADALFDQVVRSGASVIEGDSVLSDYLALDEFDRQAVQIDRLAKKAHARNLKLVWYYPSLEVLTSDGEMHGVRSMYKDFPDWVQVSIDRKPNVFYGGKEHWVDPGAESAWMCHNSPYRDYFFERVRRLARTALDGLWVDVPLFMDTVLRWVCFNRACVEKFAADTGLDAEPLAEDWTDPVWRTWVMWRHEELHRFCLDILAVARAENPGFEIVFEVVTMDTDIATVQGLDGTFRSFQLSKPHKKGPAGPLPDRIKRVWEVDSVSNDFGMRPAVHDDWMCKLRGYKFAKACDRGGPTWTFSYGALEPDAGLVMSAAVATGCSPYETRTPHMVTTVGQDFRTRMFQWIKARKELLFDAEFLPTVGLVHSASSRDFLDKGPVDTTFFVSAVNEELNYEVYKVDPSFYWGSSIVNSTYCADYGGLFKCLSHLHVPFAIVPLQAILDEDEAYLHSFKALVLPSLRCLHDRHAQMLVRYVAKGGLVICTGPDLGWDDELGLQKAEARRLDTLFGLDPAATRPESLPKAGGGGVIRHPGRLGQLYFKSSNPATFQFVGDALSAARARPFTMDDLAHRHVHLELSRHGKTFLLHAINYAGARETLMGGGLTPRSRLEVYPFASEYRVVRADLRLTVDLPAPVKSVRFASPDREFDEKEARWLGKAELEFPVHQYTLALIET